MVNTVEASVHDLRALKEELETQHQLSVGVRNEMREKIDLDLQRCQDDMALLRLPSALGDLPETFVQTLVVGHQTGFRANQEWDAGFSPMHWSAQNGRKDIIDFLINQEGGKLMLISRDTHGRTPLHYAE